MGSSASITERIIGSAFTVANTLGAGFLEKVYESALAHEITKCGLAVERQRGIIVHYDKIVVGEYVADLIVEDQVIVELKLARSITEQHIAQCLNYLRATGISLGLLINFGNPRVEIRRVIQSPHPIHLR